jgi:hypothetical protein
MIRAVVTMISLVCCASALSQGFNIDLGIGGQPSSSFGAAGEQPGYWNAGAYNRLRGLDGARSGVHVKRWTVDGGGSGSFYNPINTGDYAKLLNDAEDVGTGYQGGLLHLTFAGLQPGAYKVVTYAVIPSGGISYAPVYIPQATENQVQIVTGPMPGNSFQYLITHSVHEVRIVQGGSFELIFYRAPFAPRISVNGIQIVQLVSYR